jgi:hypothetical protein
MKTCVVENIQAGNTDVLSEILQLFKRFQWGRLWKKNMI